MNAMHQPYCASASLPPVSRCIYSLPVKCITFWKELRCDKEVKKLRPSLTMDIRRTLTNKFRELVHEVLNQRLGNITTTLKGLDNITTTRKKVSAFQSIY
jgi:hypothetical protein